MIFEVCSQVWFRKGIDGYHSGENNSNAVGTGWIEMVGNLMNISVGLFDQVYKFYRLHLLRTKYTV